MSGNWLKIEHITIDKPEIMGIADYLDISVEAAFGHVFRLWCWCDQQSENGYAKNVTVKALSRIARCENIVKAMESVGWLKHTRSGYEFVNFERHNGKTAKKRALASERMKRFRNAKGQHISNATNAPNVTNASLDKNNIKEKKINKKKEKFPEFETAWQTYPKRSGGNPKNLALRAWNARVREGVEPATMIAGVERYLAFCKATDKIGTEYVKQAATFFGPSHHYREPWTTEKKKIPFPTLTTPEDVNRAFQQYLGKPPPVGKSLDECRTILQKKFQASGTASKRWYDA